MDNVSHALIQHRAFAVTTLSSAPVAVDRFSCPCIRDDDAMASHEFSDDDLIDADIDADSEVESLFADSPSDGYFTSRNHPQESFVENSSVLAESDAKAREAAEDRAARSPAARMPSPTSSRPHVWPVESTPLLDEGLPPPDYAAAISHGSHTAGGSSRTGLPNGSSSPPSSRYGSIAAIASHQRSPSYQEQSDRQWPHGNRNNPSDPDFPFGRTFGPSGPPQAMADAGVHGAYSRGSDEEVGLLHRHRFERHGRHGHRWKKMRWHGKGCCWPLSLLNILLACVIIGIIVSFFKDKSQSNHGGSGTKPAVGDDHPDNPQTGGDDRDDPESNPRNRTWPSHPANAQCPYSHYSETDTFEFWPKDTFSLVDDIDIRHTDVTGNIWLLPAPVEQHEPIQISINYATIEDFSQSRMRYEYSDSHFTVELASGDAAPKRCMDVAIIMYVRDTVKLDHLAISTLHLNFEAGEGLFSAHDSGFHAAVADIATISGHVKADYWSSRKTCIRTSSGSVRGAFALRDLLRIQSQSGSVNIDVLPKEVDEKSPAPAQFSVITASGSIQARSPLEGNLPERDYRTSIESRSGSLSGDYIHGSLTTLVSNSGSIKINVLPYYAEHCSGSLLGTYGHSGQHKVLVLPPYLDKVVTGECDVAPGRPTSEVLNNLQSDHQSTSGSLDLSYPQAWEGMIEGKTTSGSITLRGKDVEKWGDFDIGPHRHHLLARKGYGTSKLDFQSTSGSVLIKFGED